jgi:Flp pilus assembly protein TadD
MSQEPIQADVERAVDHYFAALSRSAPREAALSEETVRDLAATARAHLHQGTQCLEAGLFDAAIQHLGQAARLMPDDLFTHVALSTAHLERYERSFRREDREAASNLAVICQALDPAHGHAVAVLGRLEAVKRDRDTLLRARLTLGAVITGLFVAVTVLVEVVAGG